VVRSSTKRSTAASVRNLKESKFSSIIREVIGRDDGSKASGKPMSISSPGSRTSRNTMVTAALKRRPVEMVFWFIIFRGHLVFHFQRSRYVRIGPIGCPWSTRGFRESAKSQILLLARDIRLEQIAARYKIGVNVVRVFHDLFWSVRDAPGR